MTTATATRNWQRPRPNTQTIIEWTVINMYDDCEIYGEYHGQQFVGTVKLTHVPGRGPLQFHVDLESPIEVYGTERNSVIVRTVSEGNSWGRIDQYNEEWKKKFN